MALRIFLILAAVTCTFAACNEGDENCEANYDGEETGLAQIKAHDHHKISEEYSPQKHSKFSAVKGMKKDACSAGQFCANGDCQVPCPADGVCPEPGTTQCLPK